MERGFLKRCLEERLSLNEIGARVGKDPSTIGYWVRKHGLVANGRGKYAPRGGIDWEVLEILADEGASLHEMAEELGRSTSTVRHWLRKYGLESGGGRRRRETAQALETGARRVTMTCRHHGETDFVLITGRNRYSCTRCRSDAVARRRRNVKRILVEDAGGKCVVCGYDQCVSALQFHHVDPSIKSFALSHAGISRSLEKARAEARKCVLLCANCHAEVEAGFTPPPVKFGRKLSPA